MFVGFEEMRQVKYEISCYHIVELCSTIGKTSEKNDILKNRIISFIVRTKMRCVSSDVKKVHLGTKSLTDKWYFLTFIKFGCWVLIESISIAFDVVRQHSGSTLRAMQRNSSRDFHLVNRPLMLLMFFVCKIKAVRSYVSGNRVHLNEPIWCVVRWIHRIDINDLRFHHFTIWNILRTNAIQYFILICIQIYSSISNCCWQIYLQENGFSSFHHRLTSISIGYCTSNKCLFDSECASVWI